MSIFGFLLSALCILFYFGIYCIFCKEFHCVLYIISLLLLLLPPLLLCIIIIDKEFYLYVCKYSDGKRNIKRAEIEYNACEMNIIIIHKTYYIYTNDYLINKSFRCSGVGWKKNWWLYEVSSLKYSNEEYRMEYANLLTLSLGQVFSFWRCVILCLQCVSWHIMRSHLNGEW